MEVLVVAIVVSLIAPATLAFLTNRAAAKTQVANAEIRHKEKIEDWDRQDKVAKQAAEAADLLYKAQQETIRKTDEVAKVAADATQIVDNKLDILHHQNSQIHTLVNSNLYEVKVSLLEQLNVTLSVMEAMIRLSSPSKLPEGIIEKTDETRKKIALLEVELEERRKQTELAEGQLKQSTSGGFA